jgi:hypothetical protein
LGKGSNLSELQKAHGTLALKIAESDVRAMRDQMRFEMAMMRYECACGPARRLRRYTKKREERMAELGALANRIKMEVQRVQAARNSVQREDQTAFEFDPE